MSKILFMLVEGDDDERFVEHALKASLQQRYVGIKVWKYAQEPPLRLTKLLRSIQAMDADYVYLCDLDLCPCVTDRKERAIAKVPRLGRERIMVVRREVESWYLAGVSAEVAARLRIPIGTDTETIGKEEFDRLVPSASSRLDFMIEVLKAFSPATAATRNPSFKYFAGRYHIPL